MAELKPCPMCGMKVAKSFYNDTMVVCVCGTNVTRKKEGEATERWNSRAHITPIEPTDDQIEAAAKVIGEEVIILQKLASRGVHVEEWNKKLAKIALTAGNKA